jgi:ABC-type uncharacterized transport system auxiliary subunit
MIDSNLYVRWSVLLVLALALGASSACGGSAPEVKHYRLDLQPQQTGAEVADKPVLGIEQFTTDAAYDEPQIVYRKTPYELNYYYYHRWATNPGMLVTDALRRGYAATGRFESVSTGQVVGSDVVLSGHISAIEEVDVTEEKWLGRVVLEMRLRDGQTGDLLWTEVFEEQERLAERSPAGLARALSEALTRVVDQSADDIAQAARQSGATMSSRLGF